MLFNKNPTIIINGLSGLLTQILPLLVFLGYIHFDSLEKLAAFISLQGLILTFVSTTILRTQVTPADKVNQLIKEALPAAFPTAAQVQEVKDKVEEKNA